MELRQLKYFVATAEELHFRKAAERVHVAQPALSQAIHQLEEEIGTLLFERTNRKVILTPAGRVFYARAKVMADNACMAVREARGVGRGDAGTIAIGFISTAALKVLPAALRHFKDVIPTAQVELCELGPGEQMDELARGHLDIGLTISEVLDEGYRVLEICREPLIAALPDTPAFAALERVDLRAVSGETVITPLRHPRRGYYETVADAYRRAGVKPANIQCVRMIQTGLMLVQAGLGVSLIPESFTQIQLKGVIYRPLVDPAPEIAVSAVWRQDNETPLLQKFISEFIEVFPR
ncbi:LysR substrate-binding domain-containing protein [Mesoterricola silvestris]|uniref:LysR family transcriptional regulator n=1 Tax=Mesoterricola silvestris TaxID=2927979 RepID=A0AA48GIR3_9BACT|nr:LysR substrate-binding domain-containing protein [Mesoterricola silvestris]BDU71799.1 LysR family transcriptional regulator [Mesoterricola silvestris]